MRADSSLTNSVIQFVKPLSAVCTRETLSKAIPILSYTLPALTLAVLVTKITLPLQLVCTTRGIANQNPNGLPFSDEYVPQLSAHLGISESELSHGWSMLSRGAAKITYEHPLLPKQLLKVGCQKEMNRQFANRQLASEILQSKNLHRLYIPESIRIANLTESGLSVSLDERLEFLPERKWLEPMATGPELEEAKEQLKTLVYEGDFCDINLSRGHNARFLKSQTEIGVFDLDCNGRYWDFLKGKH